MVDSRVCFQRIAALEGQVAQIPERSTEEKTIKRIGSRLTRVEEMINEHEQRLARHDERVNTVDNRLQTLTDRLGQIPTYNPTDDFGNRLDSIDQKLTHDASQIKRIKEKTKDNRDQIQQLRQGLRITSNDVSAEVLKKIEEKLESLTDEVNRLKNFAESPPTPISESLSSLREEFRIEIQQVNGLLAELKSQHVSRPVQSDPISFSRVPYEVSLPPADLLDDNWTE
jgi:chromosome segregation ATPase